MNNKENIEPNVSYQFKRKCRDNHFLYEMDLIDELNINIFDKRERKKMVYLCFLNFNADYFYDINREKINKDYLKLLNKE